MLKVEYSTTIAHISRKEFYADLMSKGTIIEVGSIPSYPDDLGRSLEGCISEKGQSNIPAKA